MWSRAGTWVIAGAVCAAVAGCGGSGTRSVTARSTGAAARTVSGREVFAHDCLYCHSLTGHNKPSQQGGDLLDFRATRRQTMQLTAEMPVLHHPLTQAELNAVVDYVMAVERRARGG